MLAKAEDSIGVMPLCVGSRTNLMSSALNDMLRVKHL